MTTTAIRRFHEARDEFTAAAERLRDAWEAAKDWTAEPSYGEGGYPLAASFDEVAFGLLEWAATPGSARLFRECKNCGEACYEDDNGAGGKVWCHSFGSTVCGDDPPGSLEDNGRLTVAEPVEAVTIS